MKKTKVVATIGPASADIETLKDMMLSGLNVARLNFSHGTHDGHLKTVLAVKEAREAVDLPVAIMIDLKGPEIRTGKFNKAKIILKQGQKYIITTKDIIGNEEIASVSYKNLTEDVVVGDRILIDDGLIELEIKKIEGHEIICEVKNGGEISEYKGVNIPKVKISLPAVTENDIKDIIFGINNDVDFIAISFARKAQDVMDIRKVLEENSEKDIQIVSKIENHEGVENIDEIIHVSDAIMIARGDLGVEIPPEEVPLVQKHIIRRCNFLGKPVITATQMLDSMVRNPRPTRAEVTDVATAIFDGSDAIMLSGETAIGKYPKESIQTMRNIAIKTEGSVDYETKLDGKNVERYGDITNAISFSACTTARSLDAVAILTPTSSGYTAQAVSRFRPEEIIVAAVESKRVERRLALVWGVYPALAYKSETTDELLENSINSGVEKGYYKNGDLVVITAGIPPGVVGNTNMIKVQSVGEVTIKGLGIGREVIEGNACVIKNIDDLESGFKNCDILIVEKVTKEMKKYLRKAKGLITEEHRYTSTGVVMGMNYDIPIVFRAMGVKNQIKQGDRVILDPIKGLVYKGNIKDY